MGRKPTSINQAFYGLLLVQVELEERVADVAELLFGVATVEVPTDSLQLELTTGGEHDTDEADDDSEEVVFCDSPLLHGTGGPRFTRDRQVPCFGR